MKQNQAVICALEKLGGVSTLAKLNEEVLKIENCVWRTKTPFASIRRIVQVDKRIYKIKPGLYGLKSFLKENEAKGIMIENEKNQDSKGQNEFNHTYYQGVLILVGNLKGMKTYIPNQDKNKKFIDDRKLTEIKTLSELPLFSYPHIVQRSSSIDVIWFNNRIMPHTFFEIEFSTDIQNSLLKFNDLQDFYSRMVIVADISRKREYLSKLKFSSFSDLAVKDRVSFLDYNSLVKQYENLVLQSQLELVL